MKNTQCLGGSSWPVNAWNDCSWKFGGLLESLFFLILVLHSAWLVSETSCLFGILSYMVSRDSPIMTHGQCNVLPLVPDGKLRVPLKSRTLSGWNGWCFPFDGTSRQGESHDLIRPVDSDTCWVGPWSYMVDFLRWSISPTLKDSTSWLV